MYFKVYKKKYFLMVVPSNIGYSYRTRTVTPRCVYLSYSATYTSVLSKALLQVKKKIKNTQKTDLIITKNHPLKKIYFSSFFFWYLKGLASCQYESIAAITQERACSPVIRMPEHSCLWFIIRAYFRNVFQYFLHFSRNDILDLLHNLLIPSCTRFSA